MTDLITYPGAERYLYIDPQEARYAMIAKEGAHYAIRVKFAERDNGYGLFWAPEVLERYCASRDAAKSLCEKLGFVVVSSWKKARQDYNARQGAK